MTDYLENIFNRDGFLAKRFPGYQPRAGQISLAREVDRAIREQGHLIAEAGTGTGKSVAYAVPATYHAAQSGKRVVLVTANIALQEQLVKKDLPRLAEILPWKFNYALMKGRSNYLCLDRLHNGAPGRPAPGDALMQRNIVAWAEQTTTGDSSEMLFEPPKSLWARFSVSSDECDGKDCEFYKTCHSEVARRRAGEAEVVVTNYDLFFLDLKIRKQSHGKARALPPYSIAILDEGHEAAEVARKHLGSRMTEGSIHWVASRLPVANRAALTKVGEKFFADLVTYRRTGGYKARLKKPNAVPWEELDAALTKAAESYDEQIEEFSGGRKALKQLTRRRDRVFEIKKQVAAAMTLLPPIPEEPWVPHPTQFGSTAETRWYFSDPVHGGTNEVKNEAQLYETMQEVYFLEEEKKELALCSRPVHIANFLRQQLFRMTGSVSVTSATLTIGGSFDFTIDELGMSEPRKLVAESPFEWSKQAILVLPTDVPDPRHDAVAFAVAAAEKCAEVIEAARGRTLALFTSRNGLNIAHERARKTGYRVLCQDEMPRTKLIDEFRRDVNSVLLGTKSFWEGVDVPGESLSCVFIDKLPFVTPDDPILDAMAERDPKGVFMKFSVPKAIIAFKQGFGRLIRTSTDRGAVVCLDRRITTMSYGKQFIASLPSVARSSKIEDVRNFLDGIPIVPDLPRVKAEGRSMLG